MNQAVCELESCRKEKDEAAQSFTEATNVLLSRQALLEGVIKHWEFKYGRLDRYANDLAVRNRNWEVNWPINHNLMHTRIVQRDAVIKGLTEANQSLVQRCTGFENPGHLELIHQKDTEIVGLKNERESLSQALSVSADWQEKYNALEKSSKILEEKKLCPETKLVTHFERVEKDGKSLADGIRKDTAEKKDSWASLSKLIKEKIQMIAIGEEKTCLEKMPTKDLAEKPRTWETGMEKEIQKIEMKKPEDETTTALVIEMEVQKIEVQMNNPDDESTQTQVIEMEVQKIEVQMNNPEDESTQALVIEMEVQKIEVEMNNPEDESTQALVIEMEVQKIEVEIKNPEDESTQALVIEMEVEKIKVEIKNPEDESTQAVVETPKVEVKKKEPEEFFILKKAEEVVLQKEKSRKKNKQNKKKDNKLEVKLPETQAEKTHTSETVWGDVITKPVESTKEPETPNCWNVKFTPIWMKEQQTKDNLAKKDQICETTDLPMTESAAVSQQQMESREETTLSWAAVVAKKDQICETAEVEEKETEEFPELPEEHVFSCRPAEKGKQRGDNS
ncbi:hypothetical protein PBY51_015416 [Eleginops maclovinus]|nr:hypothetical protein PBY51_015416 [Eleginops maclovinus]